MLGPDDGDDKVATLLNRTVRWTDKGIEFEADGKHRERVLEFFGLDDGKTHGLVFNGEKDDKMLKDDDEVLPDDEAKTYRGLAARLNYLSLDCPHLQFQIKECSTAMSKPTRGSWRLLKKVARYLVGRTQVLWRYR